MKKLLNNLLLTALVCFIIAGVSAQPATGDVSDGNIIKGKIIDLFAGNIVTIQAGSEVDAKPGQKMILTYMAGGLPMSIGEFEITAVQKTIIIAKPTALDMPPSKGMNIQIDIPGHKNQKPRKLPGTPPKTEPGSQKVSENSPRATDAPQQQPYSELTGKIVEVMPDETIKIKINGRGRPEVGWAADIFYVTSKGKALPVGTWKVTSVEQKLVVAAKVKGMGNARKGLKAVLHKKGKTIAAKPHMPAARPSPEKRNTVIPASKKPGGKPIQLLGETPPSAPAKKQPVSPAGNSAEKGNRSMNIVKFNHYVHQLKKKYPERTNREALRYAYRAGFWPKYWLGVGLDNNDSTLGQTHPGPPSGLRVGWVYKGSPAEKYGIKVGDILYFFNGQPMKSTSDSYNFILNNKREELSIFLDRKYEKKTVTVKLQRIKKWKKWN